MNLSELTIIKQALRNQLNEYDRITPSCNNCEHYKNSVCQHFSASPPPEWVKGPIDCQQWIYDSIPF
jgi:hypothetical protein